MNRKPLYVFVGSFILLITGAFVGFLIGTYIGGNYYPTFQLGTWTGYEATGMLGLLFGAIIGVVCARLLVRRLGK